MKGKRWSALIAGVLTLSQPQTLYVMAEEKTETVQKDAEIKVQKDEKTGYLVCDLSQSSYSSRSNVLTPDFYVFAGHVDEKKAKELIEEMEMQKVLQTWGTKVTFVQPEGSEYTAEDLDRLEETIKQAPINNIKFIGIDDGATFLNNVALGRVNYVAGMMLYGGEINENAAIDQPIPVYLSNPPAWAAEFYKKTNSADTTGLAVTVVSNGEETLKEAFANAWDQVFENNYRSSNNVTEFYNLPMLNDRENVLEFDYQLTQAPVLEDLKITYNEKVHQSIPGLDGKDYAWFEYIPESALKAEESTVPLVVSVHGNQNDPRLQGDTSGWVELASKEGFMVVSPEYQTAEEEAFFTQKGNTEIYGTVDGMTPQGIPVLVNHLKETYPQIDLSRVYITGLSQGGAVTSLLGLQNSDLFAAAASVSGVNAYNSQIQKAMENYAGKGTPFMYICGDKDFFQMIPVDGSSQEGAKMLMDLPIWEVDENVHVYPIFTAYQKANGLQSAEMDMSKNKYFGMSFDSWEDAAMGDKVIHTGKLNNSKGTVMELVAIENQAHWNYKPEAEFIWNFFQNWKRDVNTGESVYEETVQPSSDNSGLIIGTAAAAVVVIVIVYLMKKKKKTE